MLAFFFFVTIDDEDEKKGGCGFAKYQGQASSGPHLFQHGALQHQRVAASLPSEASPPVQPLAWVASPLLMVRKTDVVFKKIDKSC